MRTSLIPVCTLAVVGHLLAGLPAVHAQSFPEKPVRIIVPFAPGGAVDGVARRMAQHLSETFSQQVVVENRAGASGNIGADAVAKSAPDGYTLLLSASTLIVNPYVSKQKAPFDPVRDFTHISLIATGPLLFIVNPNVGADTVQEFIARAKAQPDKVNFATGGFGAAGHLAAEFFKSRTGVNVPTVLYKGTGPAFTDLLGGQVSAMMDPLLSSLPHVKSGKLKALAITSQQRSPLAPDVPTFAEAGLPNFDFFTWYGLWGPGNLPAPVLTRLEGAVKKVLETPEVKAWFHSQGLDPSGASGAQFVAFINDEAAKYEKIVRDAKIEPQ